MNLLRSIPSLPQFLFLDLNMPRKNGFECLREIALIERLKDISIITLTTSSQKDILAMLCQHKAHYFIRKLAQFSMFKKTIQQALTLLIQENSSLPTSEDFVFMIKGKSNLKSGRQS